MIMTSLPPINEQPILAKPSSNSRLYRFWPVYAMSFLKTFFFAIFSIALPNYLIFDQQFSSALVGTVGSVSFKVLRKESFWTTEKPQALVNIP